MTGQRGTPPAEPILHVDLDAFYASVEVLKDPGLAGKPVVVGNPSPRGVVLSASYEARARGLHSAMPSMRARRLCPDAVFVPPDFSAYQAYSNRFREILLSFTPVVEPLSLDEAFLDATGAMLLFESPKEMGERIRAAVRSELHIGASVGIGPNKLIAKLASTRAKPDGLLLVAASEVLSFLHPLPVDALWGIGEKTGQTLRRLGIRTVGELAATPRSILDRVLGESHGASLATLATGGDTRTVVPFEAPKSVSHEETYPRDLDQPDEILREMLALSHRVAARLRAEGYRARTVTLKLRLPSFSTLTRSRTIATPTDLGADIFHIASELFHRLPDGRRRFRLIGVSATGLVPAGAEQVALVREGQWEEAERALDRIEKRFGKGAAMPATLLGRAKNRPTAEGGG
ncbi:MAG TPA: DNA polymerase IV [Actinomycetota bacterium]|nr:DNA polymerase IV [Actinomycetota bacterium]